MWLRCIILFIAIFTTISYSRGPEHYSLLINAGYTGGFHKSSLATKENQLVYSYKYFPLKYSLPGEPYYFTHTFDLSSDYFFSDYFSAGFIYNFDYVNQKWFQYNTKIPDEHGKILALNRIGIQSSQWILPNTNFRITFTEEFSFDIGRAFRFPVTSKHEIIDQDNTPESNNFVETVSTPKTTVGFGIGAGLKVYYFPASQFGFFFGTTFRLDHFSIINDNLSSILRKYSAEFEYPDKHHLHEFGFHTGIAIEVARL